MRVGSGTTFDDSRIRTVAHSCQGCGSCGLVKSIVSSSSRSRPSVYSFPSTTVCSIFLRTTKGSRLRSANVLEDRKPVKIRRSEVHRLVFRSLLCYPNTRAWNRMFAETLSSQKIRDDDAGDTDRSR